MSVGVGRIFESVCFSICLFVYLFVCLSGAYILSPVSIQTQSLALRALRLDGNRAKRKRLRWQAANHGCHCFDRASYWLLLKRLRLARFPSKRNASKRNACNARNASDCVWVETGLNAKTNDPKVFKLGIGNDLGIP